MKWKKHRSGAAIIVPEHVAHSDDHTAGNRQDGSWVRQLSAVAQLGMLLVVTAGYFLTVRPAFQYQVLQEKTARLELERTEIESELRALRDDRATIQNEMASLGAELKRERQNANALAEQVRVAEDRAKTIRISATDLEKKMARDLAALDAARWELLLLDLNFSVVRERTTVARDYFSDDGTATGIESFPEFVKRMRQGWSDPYEMLVEGVDTVETRNVEFREFPPEYLQELRDYIDARRGELLCQKPDFDEILTRHSAEMAGVAKIVEVKTEQQIQELIDRSTSGRGRVLITDDFRDATRRINMVSETFRIDREYRELVTGFEFACHKLFAGVISELREAKGARR